MEISPKAWRAYGKAKQLLRSCCIDEVGVALSVHTLSDATQETMKKELQGEAYGNYLAWEALETMEGLLELLIAIQTLRNEGAITVRQDETSGQSLL